jgi:hypothetical protein
MKTCKAPGCTERFESRRPFEVWCSPEHGAIIARQRVEKARAKAAKVDRASTRAALEKLKTRQDWIREAQAVVNRYCRLRDQGRGYGCITCGKHPDMRTNADAGHWLGRGAYPEKRFNTFNIALQCVYDNRHLGGLPLKFRDALIERYGPELVQRVEVHQPAQKWTIEYLKRLKAVFSKKARRQEARNR